MTAYTDDDVTRYLAASDDNWRRETGGMEPPPNGPEDYADAEHVLAAVAPQIAARALRQAADAMLNEKGVTFADVLMVAWLRARAEQVNP